MAISRLNCWITEEKSLLLTVFIELPNFENSKLSIRSTMIWDISDRAKTTKLLTKTIYSVGFVQHFRPTKTKSDIKYTLSSENLLGGFSVFLRSLSCCDTRSANNSRKFDTGRHCKLFYLSSNSFIESSILRRLHSDGTGSNMYTRTQNLIPVISE